MYFVVSFFYIISPGPAVFLAISNGITTNMRTVAISSFGNIIGLFLLSTISILGLGALLLASSTLFVIVKLIGASYLIYLGVKHLIGSKNCDNILVQKNQPLKNELRYFSESFFLAASNPKPILFFTAIFPQFLNLQSPIFPQFFIMTFTFMTISFFSLVSYGYISKSAKKLLTNQHRVTWFHRITGGLFIGMGVGLLQLKNSQG